MKTFLHLFRYFVNQYIVSEKQLKETSPASSPLLGWKKSVEVMPSLQVNVDVDIGKHLIASKLFD